MGEGRGAVYSLGHGRNIDYDLFLRQEGSILMRVIALILFGSLLWNPVNAAISRADLTAHSWCGYSRNQGKNFRESFQPSGQALVQMYDGNSKPGARYVGSWSLNEQTGTVTQTMRNSETFPIDFANDKKT